MYENTRKTMKREGGRERKTQSNLRIQRWINGLVEEVNSRESEIQNACGLQGQSVLLKLGIRKGSGKRGGWHVIDPTTQRVVIFLYKYGACSMYVISLKPCKKGTFT